MMLPIPKMSMPYVVLRSEKGVSRLPTQVTAAATATMVRLPAMLSCPRMITDTNSSVTTIAHSDMNKVVYSEPRTSDEYRYGTML